MTTQWTAREFEMITGLPSYSDVRLDGCTCDAPNGLHFVPCQWAARSACHTVKPSTSARYARKETSK